MKRGIEKCSILLVLFLVTACAQSPTEESSQDQATSNGENSPTVWLLTSSLLLFDDGTSEKILFSEEEVELYNEVWVRGDNYGPWSIKFIEEQDWLRWGIEEMPAERKIVFQNWHGEMVDGPIMDTTFIVLYRSSSKSGQIQLQFQRALE